MANIRLIDANALDLRNRVQMDMGGLCFIEDIETAIEEVPTIDAVPVVRCKECKYQEDCIGRIQFWGRNPVLELNTTEYHPLDFCSYGERKDDGNCKED